jgi:hypothetical protein
MSRHTSSATSATDTATPKTKPVPAPDPVAQTAAFASPDLADSGQGLVLVAQPIGKTRARLATFVVDIHCLGVRKITFSELPLAALLNQALGALRVTPIAPPVALSIVQGAVAYAKSFGFPPPDNLAESLHFFDDIAPASPPFPFGKDGKPFYTQQPGDDDEFVEAVLAKLEKKPGPGNFGYEVDEPGEDWLDGEESEDTAEEE